MTAFTPERIAQLREILAKATPETLCAAEHTAFNTLPAALDEIERLALAKQTAAQIAREYAETTDGLRAELARVTAGRDEAVKTVGRLRSTLEYIKAQTRSTAYVAAPKLALGVIRANAEAALDDGFQTSVAEARSFLSRMEKQHG